MARVQPAFLIAGYMADSHGRRLGRGSNRSSFRVFDRRGVAGHMLRLRASRACFRGRWRLHQERDADSLVQHLLVVRRAGRRGTTRGDIMAW